MTEAMHIRDHREPTHFWADNEIYDVFLPQIGVYGFAVYMALARYANRTTAQSWPSINTIATQLGVSKPTVKRAIKTLEEAHLIKVDRPTSEQLAERQTNVYTLLSVPKLPRQPQNLGNDRTQARQPQTPPWATTEPSLDSDVAPNTSKRTQNIEHKGEDASLAADAAPASEEKSDYRQPKKRAPKQTSDEPAADNLQSPKRSSKQSHLATHDDTAQQAIRAYHEAFRRWPEVLQMDKIAEVARDLNRWRQVLDDWVMHGWNATNVAGMLARYQKPKELTLPPGTNGKPKIAYTIDEETQMLQAKRIGDTATVQAIEQAARRRVGI